MNDEMRKAASAAGKLPKFLSLDATELDNKEDVSNLREYIKQNRVRYVFPEGLADVPIKEQCRVLFNLELFDDMYDLAMQFLSGKVVEIFIRNDDGSETLLGRMRVKDKFDDLREMQCVADYPYLVNWMCEFLAGSLSKKFPLPSRDAGTETATEKGNPEQKQKTQRTRR